ncbi:MAG TPA: [Fe-Fe] hydrogenase large subunit C-terminal domain-containing protein [Bacillota bacterium]|jgi:iron only hydrogenase large subunit-like protein/uncharacterized Fe-S cluster-containing protein
MPIISTDQAQCRDCYRCVRSCPVKAIEVLSGPTAKEAHAQVLIERCILDGRCVIVCPQRAKHVRSDLAGVRALLRGGDPVAASLAPSFWAVLPAARPGQVAAALRLLGFEYVQETAVGAELVAAEHRRLHEEAQRELGRQATPMISSACPVVVNLIERHYPELLSYLAPVVSPMIAHARLLKYREPRTKVVFIGPCFAKKREADETGGETVDAVLTFEELLAWLAENHIDLAGLAEGSFDGEEPRLGRYFPIDGGLLKTAGFSTDHTASEVLVMTGLETCVEFLQNLLRKGRRVEDPHLIEMLACPGGCLSGPGTPGGDDPFVRRERLIRRIQAAAADQAPVNGRNRRNGHGLRTLPAAALHTGHVNRRAELPEPTEAQIKAILAQTGKHTPEDELNCGACGYQSCREKAVAVFRGWAEVEMCIPYMRRKAESMSNLIISASPNGVVAVDSELRVIEMNAAAEKMFRCQREHMIGKRLAKLFDPVNFARAMAEHETVRTSNVYPQYELHTFETIFYVDKQNVAIGILADLSEELRRSDQVQRMKMETVTRAQEVISRQMKVAQEIAGLLGETTAETKVLLTELIKLIENQGDSGQGEKPSGPSQSAD